MRISLCGMSLQSWSADTWEADRMEARTPCLRRRIGPCFFVAFLLYTN